MDVTFVESAYCNIVLTDDEVSKVDENKNRNGDIRVEKNGNKNRIASIRLKKDKPIFFWLLRKYNSKSKSIKKAEIFIYLSAIFEFWERNYHRIKLKTHSK